MGIDAAWYYTEHYRFRLIWRLQERQPVKVIDIIINDGNNDNDNENDDGNDDDNGSCLCFTLEFLLKQQKQETSNGE